MSIVYITQDLHPPAVRQNLTNKGFNKESPTQGGSYIAQPPTAYQYLFKNLQEELEKAGLPIGSVRVPHATIIAAKVVDQKPTQSWQEAESVQRTYQSYFLSHLTHNTLKII